jgi:acyl-CoA thioester hydrolase
LGVVYYGNYFTLFERGRTELMRNLGLRYRDIEDEKKIYLPAAQASCRYVSPALYDDMIRITTRIKKIGRASLDFDYEIHNSETGQLLAIGFTRHPVVNSDWKPIQIPDFIREKLI